MSAQARPYLFAEPTYILKLTQLSYDMSRWGQLYLLVAGGLGLSYETGPTQLVESCLRLRKG
jgi:hypothetical protein